MATKREQAELNIREAFRLLGEARTAMTKWEVSAFIGANLGGSPADLGGRGFVASIGHMIVMATNGREG